MTKPIVSVAAMVLWERGQFELTDEISRYLPAFADVKVFRGGTATKAFLEPAVEPIRMWHLLTHTSGLTYGFMQLHPVDAHLPRGRLRVRQPRRASTWPVRATRWPALPLRFQPGTAWGYGVSTDVLGRVLEVIAGKPLDELLEEEVLGPLGMTDTQWWVEGEDVDRLAALYACYEGNLLRYDALGDHALSKPAVLNGGGGLISTAGGLLALHADGAGQRGARVHADPRSADPRR